MAEVFIGTSLASASVSLPDVSVRRKAAKRFRLLASPEFSARLWGVRTLPARIGFLICAAKGGDDERNCMVWGGEMPDPGRLVTGMQAFRGT